MTERVPSQQTVDPLAAGYAALERGDWEASLAHFQAASVSGAPEAFEGLAMAAWWLDDAAAVFESRERAYRLYRERDDRLGAARMATWLGLDHYLYRGETAIASGWMQRAHRLLDGVDPSAEHGWLVMWEAHIALVDHSDVAAAKRASAEIISLAESLCLPDLGVLALALEGLALVNEGRVADGMQRLDEATTAAMAGEVADVDAVVTICCYLIYACERVRDYDRAAQWCEKVREFSERWSYRSMFAVCRTHYAAVLLWHGDWTRAESELMAATRDLMTTRPGWAGEGVLRLAELRRRQGRLDEASELFAQGSAHPLSLLGQAAIALERGDAVSATDLVERYLRRIPLDNLLERASGLELAARAWVAAGMLDHARNYLDSLETVVAAIDSDPPLGMLNLARGIVAAAESDTDTARRCLEDAVDLFQRHGAVYDTALARLALAGVLARSGRPAGARTEAGAALDTFRRIGAAQDAERAVSLLRELGVEGLAGSAGDSIDLTRRETVVLGLLAQGHSNQQIAELLFISVRTVERHVSTIYEKIGAGGPAARAIATSYAYEHGLAPAPDS